MMGSGKSSKARMRTEIGETDYITGKFTFQMTDRSGKVYKVEKNGIKFILRTVTAEGRYRSYESEPFEAKTTQYRSGWQVEWNSNAGDALNKLIQELWKEDWDPTSFGQAWYEIKFRRLVPEAEPEQTKAAPEETKIVTKAAAAPVEKVLPEVFRKSEARYAELRADLAAGRINPDKFRTGLNELRVQDPTGAYWTIEGQSGRWLKWDGKAWVQAEPPRS
jgi:hypothetical protein